MSVHHVHVVPAEAGRGCDVELGLEVFVSYLVSAGTEL